MYIDRAQGGHCHMISMNMAVLFRSLCVTSDLIMCNIRYILRIFTEVKFLQSRSCQSHINMFICGRLLLSNLQPSPTF